MRRTAAAASGAAAAIVLLTGSAGAARLTVAPGQTITREVGGFAARAAVTERLARAATGTVQRADRNGVLHLRYRVPTAAGRYRLLLSGRPAGAPVLPPRGTPGGDAQVIDVIVPKTLVLYLVVSGGGGGGGGVEGGTDHHGDRGGRPIPGPLAVARTGTDLSTPLRLAALALLLGALSAWLGRRPRGRSALGGG